MTDSTDVVGCEQYRSYWVTARLGYTEGFASGPDAWVSKAFGASGS